MDRRIKAILIANDVKIEKIKIVGFKDDALEIIENDKSTFMTLDGRLNENKPVEIISQDDKIEAVESDLENVTITTTIINEIVEEVDDDIFDDVPIKNVDDNIDEVEVDLFDNFDFDVEIKKIEKVEKVKKPNNVKAKKKKQKNKNKKNKGDDFIDIL